MRFAMKVGLVGVVGLTCAVAAVADAHRRGHDAPTADEIEVARQTSDLMTNTVVAALVQEINETTPANAAQGSLSIGLVFNDRNDDMRLVGKLQPLRHNDRPQDAFEHSALNSAMTGTAATSVERVDGRWYYRRSIPLSNFAPQCAMCHSNFSGMSSSEWVGALMLRIPIDTDD